MHRVVGDRTRALVGALTVAGLCWDLTNFATKRVESPRYHGGHRDGPMRALSVALLAHAPWGALAPVLASAFALDRPGARKAEPRLAAPCLINQERAAHRRISPR
jgi:hypothetical protein